MHDSKLDYFIARTEKDLDEIKGKLDKLWEFRAMIVGGSAVVSVVCSVVFNLLLVYLKVP